MWESDWDVDVGDVGLGGCGMWDMGVGVGGLGPGPGRISHPFPGSWLKDKDQGPKMPPGGLEGDKIRKYAENADANRFF